MKNFVSLFLLIGFYINVYTQNNIAINFEFNHNFETFLADSIKITNQSRMCDTMIYNTGEPFELIILSNIDKYFAENFEIKYYPNPFSETSHIIVGSNSEKITVSCSDISGKFYFQKELVITPGNNLLEFIGGNNNVYILTFKSDNSEKSIKLTKTENSGRLPEINRVSSASNTLKSEMLDNFVFYQGDILVFTAYKTSCEGLNQKVVELSPTQSLTLTFNFEDIHFTSPEKPILNDAVITQNSIIYTWNENPNTERYLLSTDNDSYTNLGNLNSFFLEELLPGTYYMIYVKAYNTCGESPTAIFSKATTALPLTQDEIDLITSGPETQKFILMSICNHPDSTILRSKSSNVIIGEEHLEHLTQRMYRTVVGTGVGLAAPQIGINRRVIWVQRQDKGSMFNRPWELYYNPNILRYSDTLVLRNDGCLSVPDSCETMYGIQGKSNRSVWIDVEYYLPDGTYVLERINHQYTAHIFQHEIDHLDGIMFFDRLISKKDQNFVIISEEEAEKIYGKY